MEDSLAQKAIAAALAGDWKEAAALNKKILVDNPGDVDALNRLARAYSEMGKINLAKEACLKALKIDPVNPIAERSLTKWKKVKGSPKQISTVSSFDAFLEEPGKTKIVDLLHPGPATLLARLDAADVVALMLHAHRVNVTTADGKYIGRLPDDLAARLRGLTGRGYQYKVLIKSIDAANVKVFIKEAARPKGSEDSPSFPPEKIEYASFTPPELVHKREELIIPEESE